MNEESKLVCEVCGDAITDKAARANGNKCRLCWLDTVDCNYFNSSRKMGHTDLDRAEYDNDNRSDEFYKTFEDYTVDFYIRRRK